MPRLSKYNTSHSKCIDKAATVMGRPIWECDSMADILICCEFNLFKKTSLNQHQTVPKTSANFSFPVKY